METHIKGRHEIMAAPLLDAPNDELLRTRKTKCMLLEWGGYNTKNVESQTGFMRSSLRTAVMSIEDAFVCLGRHAQ